MLSNQTESLLKIVYFMKLLIELEQYHISLLLPYFEKKSKKD